jgi:hypothetical protein
MAMYDKPQLVIGLGRLGGPFLDYVSKHVECVGIDLEKTTDLSSCSAMHICVPYEGQPFVRMVVNYIERFSPRLVLIHSVVAPGTTRSVYDWTECPIAHTPLLRQDPPTLDKPKSQARSVGPIGELAKQEAAEVLKELKIETHKLPNPETTEISKLTNGAFQALLKGWAQEIERYCNRFDIDYEDVMKMNKDFPPTIRSPKTSKLLDEEVEAPQLELLRKIFKSRLLTAIADSNEKKREMAAVSE